MLKIIRQSIGFRKAYQTRERVGVSIPTGRDSDRVTISKPDVSCNPVATGNDLITEIRR